MATQLQFRRGSTGQTNSFTGAVGEVTVDTDKNVVVVHDGTTAGGWPAPQLSFVQAAFDKANTSNAQFSVAAFDQANAAFLQANTAFAAANNVAPQIQPAFDTANSAALYANAAFAQANTKLSSSGGTISGNLQITGNNIPTTDNVYSLGSSTNRWKDLYVGPGSVYIDNIVLGNTGGKLVISGVTDLILPSSTAPATTNISDNANNAYTHANAAYANANTKFNSSGGTISGTVVITQDLNVSGNLSVTGNITSLDVNNVTLSNGIIYLADSNSGNTIDIGVVGAFTEGYYQHTGLIRDNADGVWKFFSNVTSEPTSTVDLTGAIYDSIKVGGIEAGGTDLVAYSSSAYGQANAAATLAQNAYNAANNAGSSITDDTSTSATYYPIFATANTGVASTVKVSSTKLTFNPSTGVLTAVDINSSSDINFKENVQPISSALSTVQALQGVSFNWKDNGNKSYGVIAQQLQEVLPELVHQSEHGLTVSYLPLIAFLIEAIKEQQKQIDELKK